MSLLWLAFAILIVVALVMLLRPLMRPAPPAVARGEFDMRVYRNQLRELEDERERGAIGAQEARAARVEIERRMLAAAEMDGDTGGGGSPASTQLITIVLAVGLPLAAGGIYLELGSPHLTSRPAVKTAPPGAANEAQMRTLIARLEARLEKTPKDGAGWLRLGRSYRTVGRNDDAAKAFARAMALTPDRPDIAADYGEALTLAAGRHVGEPARKAFEKALAAAPKDPRARYYLGLAKAQADDAHGALAIWLALEAESPADAPWLAVLKRSIDAVAKRAKIDVATLRRKRPGPEKKKQRSGPSAGDVEAAGRMSPSERQAMILGMVQRLEDRLKTTPKDAEGWRRLGRVRTVLGEHKKAVRAYARAASLRPRDVTLLVDYGEALVRVHGDKGPLAPVLVKTMRQILALDAGNAVALWYLGLAESRAGDRAAALEHWRRLLARLPADAPERADLERRIAKLEQGG